DRRRPVRSDLHHERQTGRLAAANHDAAMDDRRESVASDRQHVTSRNEIVETELAALVRLQQLTLFVAMRGHVDASDRFALLVGDEARDVTTNLCARDAGPRRARGEG